MHTSFGGSTNLLAHPPQWLVPRQIDLMTCDSHSSCWCWEALTLLLSSQFCPVAGTCTHVTVKPVTHGHTLVAEAETLICSSCWHHGCLYQLTAVAGPEFIHAGFPMVAPDTCSSDLWIHAPRIHSSPSSCWGWDRPFLQLLAPQAQRQLDPLSDSSC